MFETQIDDKKIRQKFVCKLVNNILVINHFSPSNPCRHYMYYQVYHSQTLRSAHTLYLCVLYGSQNKQRLFPYTTLTDWFL